MDLGKSIAGGGVAVGAYAESLAAKGKRLPCRIALARIIAVPSLVLDQHGDYSRFSGARVPKLYLTRGLAYEARGEIDVNLLKRLEPDEGFEPPTY